MIEESFLPPCELCTRIADKRPIAMCRLHTAYLFLWIMAEWQVANRTCPHPTLKLTFSEFLAEETQGTWTERYLSHQRGQQMQTDHCIYNRVKTWANAPYILKHHADYHDD